MRHVSLIVLALLFAAGSADAAKPTAQQVQSLAADTDLSCRVNVLGLPGGESNEFDPKAICACAHTGTIANLQNLDLDNPASPSNADQDKIASGNKHAIWACAQPSYAKLLVKSMRLECNQNVGSIASARDLSDAQKLALCDCVGDRFAQLADLTKVEETNPGKMPTFANDTLQQAYSACKAKVPARQ